MCRQHMAQETLHTFAVLYKPTIDQELEYARARRIESGSREMANRHLSKLIKFSGDDSKLSWESFQTRMLAIIKDVDYTEAELKQILISALEGRAFTFLDAHPEWLDLRYGELMKKLEDNFAYDKERARYKLNSVRQGVKETIREYSARLHIIAKSLRHVDKPNPLAWCEMFDAGAYPRRIIFAGIIPNPALPEEQKRYEDSNRWLEDTLKHQFKVGLLPMIKSRVDASKKFDTFEQQVEATINIEHFLEEDKLNLAVNHLYATPELSEEMINALQAKGYPQSKEDVVCWGCGKMGHYKSDCTNPTLDRGGRSDYQNRGRSPQRRSSPGRSRDAQRPKSRSNSRGSKKGSRPSSRNSSRDRSSSYDKLRREFKTLKTYFQAADESFSKYDKKKRSTSKDAKESKRAKSPKGKPVVNALSVSKNVL